MEGKKDMPCFSMSSQPQCPALVSHSASKVGVNVARANARSGSSSVMSTATAVVVWSRYAIPEGSNLSKAIR